MRRRSLNRRDLEGSTLRWLAADEITFGVALLGTYWNWQVEFC